MKQNRRSFLQTSTLLTTGTVIGSASGLAGLNFSCSVAAAGTILVNPTPLFEISPLLYMQFMEPLGSTEPSVEGAWDYDRDDWREDFIACVSDLAPDMIRWGGIFNRYYKWREGIGPVDKRPWMYNHQWEGKETNRVGTHEIVGFCRRVGAQPILGVNFESDGFEHFKKTAHGQNRFGTSEEAADWVSYCNDLHHRERAANGSGEPLGVTYWQLGNESSYGGEAGFNLERYLHAMEQFSVKMRQRDPSIQLIGWGDAADCSKLRPGQSLEGNEPWAARVLEASGNTLNFIAFHMMGIHPDRTDTVLKSFDYLADPAQAWEELVEMGDIPEYRVGIFRDQLLNGSSKAGLAITEGHLSLSPYNTNTILRSWLSVAYHARALNSYLRNGDIVKIATAADFNGARWTVNAVMMPEPRGNSFLLPVGHLMKWFNREKGSHGLSLGQSPGDLDISASRTGNTIYLHVLNKRFDQSVVSDIVIPGVKITGGTVFEMAPQDRMIHIDQTVPDLFHPVEKQITSGDRWTFPAASVSIVRLTVEPTS